MTRTVKWKNIQLTKYLFSNEIIIAILLLPFFKPNGLGETISEICNILMAFECGLFLGINLLENRMTLFHKVVFVLEAWIYLFAPIISKHVPPSFYYLVGTLGIISFLELGFSVSARKTMKAMSRVFTIMIVWNALMLLLMPEGMVIVDGVSIWLFGMRTGFSLYVIPGIFLNLLYDKYEKKTSLSTVITIITGLFSLIVQWVVTGIVQFIVAVVLILFLKNEKIAKKINLVLITVVIFMLDILITIFGAQNGIMSYIALLMNRDITLTGRTEIWPKVVEKLRRSPITGVGNDAVVSVGLEEKSAHNHWLHVSLEGGYIAFALLVLGILIVCIYLHMNRGSKWYSLCTTFIITILVGSMVEIQTYVPFFYIAFEIPFLLLKMDEAGMCSKT